MYFRLVHPINIFSPKRSAVTFTVQWIFLGEICSFQWIFKQSGILWGTKNSSQRVQVSNAVWHADQQMAACSVTSYFSTLLTTDNGPFLFTKFCWTLTVSMGTRASNGNYSDEMTLPISDWLLYAILRVTFSLIQSIMSEPSRNIQSFLKLIIIELWAKVKFEKTRLHIVHLKAN